MRYWSYLEEYKNYRSKILKSVDKTLKSGNLFFGKELLKFEKNFIKANKLRYGVAVGSGTDALLLALRALNIGDNRNDEVITVSNTAIPTISAIISAGAKPVFVDIGEDYLIDPEKIQKKININTKAIIPVHLYGQPCDMKKILKIAKRNKIRVIEDCAQAQGAKFNKRYVGTLGDFGCFSFYPTKILGAYGDGGFITTNDENLFDRMQRIRSLGMEKKKMSSSHWNGKYYAVEHGTNSRLDEVHAAILLKKLPYLDKWIDRRRQIAERYNNELKDTDLELPEESPNNKHAYHVYVVAHKHRDQIMKSLSEINIQLNILYPWPIHIMDAYKHFVCSSCTCLKKTEEDAKKIFSLPMYPTLTDEEQGIVIKEIKNLI